MTEEKKKTNVNEGEPWKIGNPLFDGTLKAAAEKLKLMPQDEFIGAISDLILGDLSPEETPEIYEYVDHIKEAVRERFLGSTSWEHYDCYMEYIPSRMTPGDYWNNWDYSYRDYFLRYYGRSEDWTINEILRDLTESSDILDLAEAVIPEAAKLISAKYPDYYMGIREKNEARLREYEQKDKAIAADLKKYMDDMTEDLEIIRLALDYAQYIVMNEKKHGKGSLELYMKELEIGGASEEKPRADTLAKALANPRLPRSEFPLAHSSLSRELGRKNPNPKKIQTTLDDLGNIRNILFVYPQNKNTEIKGHIDTIDGRGITKLQQTIMGAVYNALIETSPRAFEDGAYNLTRDILETDLVAMIFVKDGKDVTPEDREIVRDNMFFLKGTMYTGEWGEYMSRNPAFKKKIQAALPNSTGRVKLSLINFDMYETVDAMGNYSWRYILRGPPILDYLDNITGMSSKLRYSIKETPVIPWESIPEPIKTSMDGLTFNKSPTIQIYNIGKDGKKYIPSLRTREKAVFMESILRELESYNRVIWMDDKLYFDLDLDAVYRDVWGDPSEIGRKYVLTRKTAMLSYLYRLWIKCLTGPEPEGDKTAQVHGLTVLVKGKSWPMVRIYLRDPVENVPPIVKIPSGKREPPGDVPVLQKKSSMDR